MGAARANKLRRKNKKTKENAAKAAGEKTTGKRGESRPGGLKRNGTRQKTEEMGRI